MTLTSRNAGPRQFAATLLVIALMGISVSGTAKECQVEFLQPDGAVHHYTAEIAQTPAERAQGLMARTELAPAHGMLFDFGRSIRVAMWMKDTVLPLDMVFITANGRVRRIERGTVPLSETTISSRGRIRYVLEVSAGDAALLVPGHDGSRFNVALLANCLVPNTPDY